MHLPPGRWEQAEKLEQLRALEHGFPIHIVETQGDTLEVDTPADLPRAEAYFAAGPPVEPQRRSVLPPFARLGAGKTRGGFETRPYGKNLFWGFNIFI